MRLGPLGRVAILIAAFLGLAPPEAPENPDLGPGSWWWGGNTGGWAHDCNLSIQNPGFCSGGFHPEDGDPSLDPYWWVQCNEERCLAGARCPPEQEGGQPVEIECEGAYKGQAADGAVYCFDNGSGIPMDNDWC